MSLREINTIVFKAMLDDQYRCAWFISLEVVRWDIPGDIPVRPSALLLNALQNSHVVYCQVARNFKKPSTPKGLFGNLPMVRLSQFRCIFSLLVTSNWSSDERNHSKSWSHSESVQTRSGKHVHENFKSWLYSKIFRQFSMKIIIISSETCHEYRSRLFSWQI